MIGTETAGNRTGGISWTVKTLLFTGIGLALGLALSFFHFGSVGAALGSLRGDRLIVGSSLRSFGEVTPGQRPTTVLEFMNISDRAITLCGSKATCTCVVTEELPCSLPPGARRSVNIAVRTDSVEGSVDEIVSLFTDFPAQPRVALRVVGRISRPAGRPVGPKSN